MSADNSTRNVCQKHEALEVSLARIEFTTREGLAEINSGLKAILTDLREGAVEIATLRVRLALVERVTYGCVAIALTGLAVAILSLVLKGGA